MWRPGPWVGGVGGTSEETPVSEGGGLPRGGRGLFQEGVQMEKGSEDM